MLDLEDDMRGVFFSDDFAARFQRTRAGQAAQDVVGILGIADDEALEGRVIAAARTLLLPAASDVRSGDTLQALDNLPSIGVPAGTRFRVLDVPRRVNDGAEMEALLGSVQG